MPAAAEARPIVVLGAGGHAKVVIDCLRIGGWNVIGCIAAGLSVDACVGAPVIGGDEKLPHIRAQGVEYAFCAVGDNSLRERLCNQLLSSGFHLPILHGPGSNISPMARLGQGVAVLPGASINVDTLVGDFAIINTNSNVDHDGVLGRAVHIGPGAALAGEVQVGDRTFVATGSSVVPRIRIGPDSVIGAGSVIVRDIPGKVIAFGNPARVRRQI